MRPLLLVLCFALNSSGQAFSWPDGKRVAVSLSFDDARSSHLTTALALFDRLETRVTFYVNPRHMQGGEAAWRAAAARGYEIGNHTDSHPCTANFSFSRTNALEDYTLDSMARELDASSARIEAITGVKPRTFAYPCGQKWIGRGASTRSYVPLIAERYLLGRGFRDEVANDPARMDPAQAMGIDSDGLSFDEMKTLVETAAAESRWLIFAGHEVGSAGRQTTRVDALEPLIRWMKTPASGVWLAPVSEIAAYLRDHASKPAPKPAN